MYQSIFNSLHYQALTVFWNFVKMVNFADVQL